MEFSCGQCGTRYSVPDEKVRGKRVRTKCRKCQAEIVIEGGPTEGGAPPKSAVPVPVTSVAPAPKPAAPAAAPAPAPAPRAEERWTVAFNRADQRKMTTSEIVEAFAGGTLTNQNLVWKHGMPKWEPPFDIPALALALSSKGIERPPPSGKHVSVPPPPAEKKASLPPPPVTPAPVAKAPMAPMKAPMAPMKAPMAPMKAPIGPPLDPIAQGWDDDNEATRVSEGAIPFMARRMLPQTPKRPEPAKAFEPPKPAPKPVPAAPKAAPAAPKPPPAPKPAPPPAQKPLVAAKVVAVGPSVPAPADPSAHVADTKRPPPSDRGEVATTVGPLPSSPAASGFDFEDESTAVIAPDRARELLDAEMKKSTGPGTPVPPADAPQETPLAFSFDDESTKVIEPGRAEELLEAQAKKTPSEHPPAFPEVAAVGPLPLAKSDSGRFKSTEENAPSVLVDGRKPEAKSKEEEKAKAKAKVKESPKPPKPPEQSQHEIIRSFQNEPTRVVRVVQKPKKSNFWLVFGLALVAAAASGFVASEIMARHHAVRPKGP